MHSIAFHCICVRACVCVLMCCVFVYAGASSIFTSLQPPNQYTMNLASELNFGKCFAQFCSLYIYKHYVCHRIRVLPNCYGINTFTFCCIHIVFVFVCMCIYDLMLVWFSQSRSQSIGKPAGKEEYIPKESNTKKNNNKKSNLNNNTTKNNKTAK